MFKVLEVTYLVFFLPLSCYESDEVSNFMGVALVVYVIGLAQVTFAHVNNFITKKIKHYRLINKSLGYWVELGPGDTPPTEVYEWDRDRSPRLERDTLCIKYRGVVYLKVLQSDVYFTMGGKSVGLIDRLLLVFLKGITSTKGFGPTP